MALASSVCASRTGAPWRLAALLFALATPAAAERAFDCVIDPSETVKVGSPLAALVASVAVERGQVVAKGDVIATLESTVEEAALALHRARAESTARIDAQAARLGLARARLGRVTQLVGRQIVAQDRYEELQADAHVAEQDLVREQQERRLAALEAERSRAILEQRTIRAPVSGVVVERRMAGGEYISQEGRIVTLARLDPLYVEAFLPVATYGRIGVGTVAGVRPDPPVTGTFPAKVVVVDSVFDATSGTYGVRLALPNEGNRLPGGQRCKVVFDVAP